MEKGFRLTKLNNDLNMTQQKEFNMIFKLT